MISFKGTRFQGGTAATTAQGEKAFREHLSQNLLYHYFLKQNHFTFRHCFTYLPQKTVILSSPSPAPPPCPSAPRDSSKLCLTRNRSCKLSSTDIISHMLFFFFRILILSFPALLRTLVISLPSQ